MNHKMIIGSLSDSLSGNIIDFSVIYNYIVAKDEMMIDTEKRVTHLEAILADFIAIIIL